MCPRTTKPNSQTALCKTFPQTTSVPSLTQTPPARTCYKRVHHSVTTLTMLSFPLMIDPSRGSYPGSHVAGSARLLQGSGSYRGRDTRPLPPSKSRTHSFPTWALTCTPQHSRCSLLCMISLLQKETYP